MRINGTSISTAIFAVIILAIMNVTGTANGFEETTSDIVIEGNSSFSTSTYVSGGNGTSDNPYVISGYSMDYENIQIKNTTSHLLIQDITMKNLDRWAFYFLNVKNVLIQNINSTSINHFLFISDSNNVGFRNCNVTDFSGGTMESIIDVRSTSAFYIFSSYFSKRENSQNSKISQDATGSNQKIYDSFFYGVDIDNIGFEGDDTVANSTFINCTISITNGNAGGKIVENSFNNDDQSCVFLVNSALMDISNNTFLTKSAIGIEFSGYGWVQGDNYGYINDNIFEGGDYGIGPDQDVTYSRIYRFDIRRNYFGNNSVYAIDFDYGFQNNVITNIFYHNRGTGDHGSGAQVTQLYSYGIYKNYYTENGVGNYWANHRYPDDNNDGIVDMNYTFNVNGEDSAPFTNRYFDTTPPDLVIGYPSGEYATRSYFDIHWTSEDEESGIGLSEMKIIDGKTYNTTGSNRRSIFLEKGTHEFVLDVRNGADLYSRINKSVTLNTTYDVITINNPGGGEILNDDPVNVDWAIKSYFPLMNISFSFDESVIYPPLSTRKMELDLEEGDHSARIRIGDDQGLFIEKWVNFTVDRTHPEINIISPQAGSILSNNDVMFNWNVFDNFGIQMVKIGIDDEQLNTFGETSYTKLLPEGNHTFHIRAYDIGGLHTTVDIPFTIGYDDDLIISNPLDGLVSNAQTIEYIWSYEGSLNWERSLLRIGRSGNFQDIGGIKEKTITLKNEGSLEITLRLEDDYNNYIQREITVFKDTKLPKVAFVTPSNPGVETVYMNTNSPFIDWIGIDEYGISDNMYRIDEGDWISLGEVSNVTLDLSDGEYRIDIMVSDLAGNIGDTKLDLVVDTMAPVAKIKKPTHNHVTDGLSMEVSWTAMDSSGIIESILLVTGLDPMDITGETSTRLNIREEGEYRIIIRSIDNAGNIGISDPRSIIVDFNSPTLEWLGDIDPIVNSSRIMISWKSHDTLGISNTILVVNDITYNLGTGACQMEINLIEGINNITLFVYDLAGKSTELATGILLDLKQPFISVTEKRIENGSARLTWLVLDNESDPHTVLIKLDDGDFIEVSEDGDYDSGPIGPGNHTIIIQASDSAGNTALFNWEFNIEKKSDSGSDSRCVNPIIMIISTVVILLIILLAVILFIRSRNSADNVEERKTVKTPQKLSLNLPMQPARQQIANGNHQNNLPPAPQSKVEETDIGSGYIRPTSKPQDLKKEKGYSGKILNVNGEKKAEQSKNENKSEGSISDQSPVDIPVWNENKMEVLK